MKSGIRAIGIDDGPLKPKTLVVGVIMRRDRVEGIISSRIKRDGSDATEVLGHMIQNSRYFPQIKVVFVNGIALGGLNLVDFPKLVEELKCGVIAVTPNIPHPDEVEELISKFPDKMEVWKRIKKEPIRLDSKFGPIWFQPYGINTKDAERLIRAFQIHSKVPEPLRLAHIIAAGIELGESKGGH